VNSFFDHRKIGAEWIKAQSTTRILALQTFFLKKVAKDHDVQKYCSDFTAYI